MLRDGRFSFDRAMPRVRLAIIVAVASFGALVVSLRGPAQLSGATGDDAPPAAKAADPTASPQDGAKLRYGYKKGERHYYAVKVAVTLPDEEVSHDGSLVYDVLSSSDEQFTLRCTGKLLPVRKAKAGVSPSANGPRIAAPPGMSGRRGIPGAGRHVGPGAQPMRPRETTFDFQGKIIRRGESPSLPLLLGSQVGLVIEEFPVEPKQAWSTERELGVVEHDESGPRFGPFRGGSETNRGAKERIDYAVVGQDQDSIRISRKYALKTAAEQGVTHIDMSGDGELVFDKKLGVLRSERMKYEIRVNEKNVAVTIPFTLDCRLMSDDEVAAQKKKEAEEKKIHEERIAKLKADRAARENGELPRRGGVPTMRTWREAAGSRTIRATFVELKANTVTVKRADGRVVDIPLEKLSKADQAYSKQQAEAVKGKTEDPFE